ncbi:MAG: clostripain-related cysteine peptidase, partial [Acidobacteria bacterium]|nr:clostripain-related cysteine peptidase [Acidobacteriota bacterium]
RNESGDEDEAYTDRGIGGLQNWTTAKYLVIEKGRLRQLADLGELNMGDPANLVGFVENTVKRFPAEKYALIFGDHGAGWPGILGDESAGGDHLDMTELHRALTQATKATGKLELIGFDACLMANFEVAKTVSPFAKYMVGSEELEPGNGWNYTPLLTALTGAPSMDGLTLARTVVDTFRDFYASPSQGERDAAVTLSVMDLSRIDAVATALSDLGARNQAFMKSGGRDAVIRTARARSSSESFGGNGSGDDGDDFFDMVDYAEQIKAAAADTATAKSADALVAAARAAIVYKIHGDAHPRANGLSVYFPASAEPMVEDRYTAQPFAAGDKWSALLADYTGIMDADTTHPALDEAHSSDVDIDADDVASVTSSVRGDDIDEATFVLARHTEKGPVIIGAMPAEPDDKGVLHEEWDGQWFAVGDGKKEVICPITAFDEIEGKNDEYLTEVPAQIRYRGRKEWHDITMYFVLDFKGDDVAGHFVYAFQEVRGQMSEVELESGDSIRPVYLSLEADGDEEPFADVNDADILTIDDKGDLYVATMDVPPGDYMIGFAVTDYAGNDSETFVDVEISAGAAPAAVGPQAAPPPALTASSTAPRRERRRR